MRVLLAIDDADCSEAAVQAVIDRFPRGATEVLLVHVLDWPKGLSPSLAFSEGPRAADHVLSVHDELRRRGQALIDRARQRLEAAHVRVRGELHEGDPSHVILACAEDWRPDVIVVGSHGRRGLERLLIGSVAEAVVKGAPCSVDVVRARV
ncbi:MAG TPA: universal stress protein [Vicinamibacterales bacterium]|nr:universal stress protein [Vicinamibacterales bacterium]